jgi:hypothetical protein
LGKERGGYTFVSNGEGTDGMKVKGALPQQRTCSTGLSAEVWAALEDHWLA